MSALEYALIIGLMGSALLAGFVAILRLKGAVRSEVVKRVRAEESLTLKDAQLIQASKMSTLGTLAAGLVHELNNPLTTVSGFANQILKEEVKLSDASMGYLSRVVNSSNRMKKLVDHVRLYVRESNKDERHLVDLRQSYDNTLILLELQMSSTNVSLVELFDDKPRSEMEKSEALYPVKINKVQIESVIQNVIVNSLHAFESTNKGDDKYIQMKMFRSDGIVSIIFEDNASGMSCETVENIFNPFFTTKAENEGTGLGMSVSKTIIDDHDGKIRVESVEGEFARTSIDLPMGSEEQLLELIEIEKEISDAINSVKQMTQKPLSPPVRQAKFNQEIYWPRVLVIDDEQDILDLLSMMVGDTFDLVLEQDSRIALEKIGSEHYDLIVTDVSMPFVSGMQITKAARELVPNTPVIIISGHARKNAGLNELLDAGAVDLIPKPFMDEDEIREVLMSHYNRRQETKAG